MNDMGLFVGLSVITVGFFFGMADTSTMAWNAQENRCEGNDDVTVVVIW